MKGEEMVPPTLDPISKTKINGLLKIHFDLSFPKRSKPPRHAYGETNRNSTARIAYSKLTNDE